MIAPHTYPHRALVAASGMSPQIITETLYAIAVHQQPAFVPTEIHILTTIDGRTKIQASLLTPESGHLHRLVRDYRLDPTLLDHVYIHVVADAQGGELNDIVEADDNAGFANLAADVIRRLSERADCAMHVSLAGGRKTMSYYTGYALSMFGRPQDALSHVLVEPRYERCHEFYYPTSESVMMQSRGTPDNPSSEMVDASKARVSLASIPFVRMRDILVESLPESVTTFDQTVEEIVRRGRLDTLVFDIAEQKAFLGDEVLDTEETFMLYAWMAWRKKRGRGPLVFSGKSDNPEYAREFLAFRQANFDDAGDRFETACHFFGFDERLDVLSEADRKTHNSAHRGISTAYLSTKLSKMKRAIKDKKFTRYAELYAPVPVGGYKTGKHIEIRLAEHHIQFRGLAEGW